ncbi:MAG TPA: prepilin-type N-terminal cleavage/methylation domain-containing protein [Gammaproteobacteria bacterium]|nr:prepilin-type N-terminal cleavage/methylation domain-containing protein [Gammaproteobacteria bacterium]
MNSNSHNLSVQRGFSLVELMIALVLGLILLGGTFQIFFITKNGQRLQNGMANVQENGRYAIYALRENILMAGYSTSTDLPPFDPDRSLDGENDQITVRFESTTDCLGTALPAAAAGIAVNRIFVDAESNTLRCQGNGGGASAALVDGIEGMQILYGLDEDGDNVANRYLTASELPDWNSIVSVRIAVLARSKYKTGIQEAREYTLLDAPAIRQNDALTHSVFTTTIPLRNRML